MPPGAVQPPVRCRSSGLHGHGRSVAPVLSSWLSNKMTVLCRRSSYRADDRRLPALGHGIDPGRRVSLVTQWRRAVPLEEFDRIGWLPVLFDLEVQMWSG